MKLKCVSAGQYKCYDVTVYGFIHGAGCSFLFPSAAVIVFDYRLFVNVFGPECVQPGVYL